MTMSTTVAVYLILTLIIVFSGLCGMIRWYIDSQRGNALSRREQILAQIYMEPAQNFSRGLTRFAGNRADDHPPECTICISEFIEGEMIRVLSRCRHGFHAYCIEQWLLSNQSSCPICRASCRRILPAETSQQQPQQQQLELQIQIQEQEQEQHPQEQEQPLNDVVDDIERFESYFSAGNFSGRNIYGGSCN